MAAQQVQDNGRLGTASGLGAYLARLPDLDRGTVWSGSCALEAACDASGWPPLAVAFLPVARHADTEDMHPVNHMKNTPATSQRPCQLLVVSWSLTDPRKHGF